MGLDNSISEKFVKAKTLTKEGDFEQAIEIWEEVIPVIETERYSQRIITFGEGSPDAHLLREYNSILKALASAYGYAGKCYYKVGKYEESLEYFKKALQEWLDLKDEVSVLHCYEDIAKALEGMREFQEAIRIRKHIDTRFKELKLEKFRDGNLNLLGMDLFNTGAYEEAYALHKRLIPMLIKTKRYEDLAYAYNRFANLSWKVNKSMVQYFIYKSKALEYFRKVCKDLDDDQKLGILRNLAENSDFLAYRIFKTKENKELKSLKVAKKAMIENLVDESITRYTRILKKRRHNN